MKSEMPSVDITIPVYNEEKDLPRCIAILHDFLQDNLPCHNRVVIADNGSVDNTLAVARALAQEYPEVSYFHIPQKGRGRALRHSWMNSQADIVSYMDVDLSTDLSAFPLLVEAISQGCSVAVGSRLLSGAKVSRSLKRELISRSYNFLVKCLFLARFSDAQCGFKALKREVAQDLVPMVKDQAWFFDTELLILAEKKGYPIKEFPVTWREDPDTRVKILKTALDDLKGLLRLRFRPPPQGP